MIIPLTLCSINNSIYFFCNLKFSLEHPKIIFKFLLFASSTIPSIILAKYKFFISGTITPIVLFSFLERLRAIMLG